MTAIATTAVTDVTTSTVTATATTVTAATAATAAASAAPPSHATGYGYSTLFPLSLSLYSHPTSSTHSHSSIIHPSHLSTSKLISITRGNHLMALRRAFLFVSSMHSHIRSQPASTIYFELVYFVTAFVPSLTACFANSPGNSRRTAVWISRLVIVDRLL